MLYIIDDWVILDYLRWAVCLFDLLLHVCSWVFHEYCWVWIRLAHLGLALFHSHKHVVWYDDWFVLLFDAITVLFCQHINLSLVETKLTNICFQKEDICTLHARIHYLWSWHVISVLSSHDLTAFLYSCDIEFSRDINYDWPVLVSSLIDLIRCPEELNVRQIHTSCFPHFDKISADYSDFFEIATHFVV